MTLLERGLDATALLAAVVGEAAATLAAPITVGRGPDAVPGALANVSAAWLEQTLRRTLPGARITDIRQLGQTAGTTDRARIAIDYATPDARHPASVFVKLAPADLPTRIFGGLVRLGTTEVRFYESLASEVPVMVPHCHGTALDARARRFALVLEDLGARGATFTDVAQPITADTARRVVTELARLHAAYWASPRFDSSLAWLKTPRRNPTIRLERALCAAALGPGLRRFPALIPDAIRHAAPQILAARDHLDARWATRPPTLIHGDSHSGNLYIVGDRVGFLDWQVTQCGAGLRDVSYFLISSLPTELRLTHQRELLAHYLACLAADRIAAPSLEDAWHDHRLHAFHAWIAAIVTAAAATLQIEPIARAAVDRANRALVDLDALRALETLDG